MPLIRTLHSRGARTTVIANAEVLFTPNGDVSQWMRDFSRKATRFAAQEAPSNRRPRWKHYGKPLKSSFTSTTLANPSSLQVASAIGSSSPYSAYVDQGTGIYGGNGPYQAKILPPWSQGSPSLYEHTWIAGDRRIGTVTIRGQKGQFFFDKALKRAFIAKGMVTTKVPGEPGAFRSWPGELAEAFGNTPWSFAFDAQLREWRAWRDAAWDGGRVLGVRPSTGSTRRRKERRTRARGWRKTATPEQRRAWQAKASRKYRQTEGYRRLQDAKRAQREAEKKVDRRDAAKQAERERVVKIALTRYSGLRGFTIGSPRFVNGRWEVPISGPNLPPDFVLRGRPV